MKNGMLALCAALISAGIAADAQEWLGDGYANRMRLNLTEKAAAGNLENFPVCVRLNGDELFSKIYLYFNNPGAQSKHDPVAVWSNGYLAVWHMNGKDSAPDSLGNFNLTLKSGAGTVPALIGTGVESTGGKAGLEYRYLRGEKRLFFLRDSRSHSPAGSTRAKTAGIFSMTIRFSCSTIRRNAGRSISTNRNPSALTVILQIKTHTTAG